MTSLARKVSRRVGVHHQAKVRQEGSPGSADSRGVVVEPKRLRLPLGVPEDLAAEAGSPLQTLKRFLSKYRLIVVIQRT
jgi:hypothetical protein